MVRPSREGLEVLLRACGIALRPDQYDALWAYHRLLREANAELNLTRLHNFESMVLKHYVDSLLVLKYEAPPSPLMDMGSGPGLPGVPLKIARPDLEMVLAEPRGHRAEFLESVIARLKLTNVDVYAGKVGPKFTREVGGVITRAVASIPETLDRVVNCLGPGGKMLFMKGPDCDNEVAEARSSHASSFRLLADHSYAIPGTNHQRRLVVYERIGGATLFSGPPARELASASNATFKHLRELLTGRGVRKHGEALLAGPRIVNDLLRTHADRALGWITPQAGPAPPESLKAPWLRLEGGLFQELDVSGTHSPLLWMKVPEMPEWTDDGPWPAGCTLFIPLQDPENVGAVVRSAAAFGVARVVLLREAAHPFHPKAARAAGPGLFQVPLAFGPSIQGLHSDRVPIIALDNDGPTLASSPFPESFGLVVGLEGPGLPEYLRQGPKRRVPITDGTESLNAAAAVAIALYEWRRQAT
mgnify:CR=1 FL=1